MTDGIVPIVHRYFFFLLSVPGSNFKGNLRQRNEHSMQKIRSKAIPGHGYFELCVGVLITSI